MEWRSSEEMGQRVASYESIWKTSIFCNYTIHKMTPNYSSPYPERCSMYCQEKYDKLSFLTARKRGKKAQESQVFFIENNTNLKWPFKSQKTSHRKPESSLGRDYKSSLDSEPLLTWIPLFLPERSYKLTSTTSILVGLLFWDNTKCFCPEL